MLISNHKHLKRQYIMKLNKLFFATIASVALMFAACEQPDGPQGPTIDDGQDTTQVVPGDNWEIPADANIPADAITVAEARAICEKLESGATTGTKYYVKGFVKKLHSKHTQETITQYGNGQFYMVDEKGAADDFMAYQVYGMNGQKLVSVDQVAVGDYVVIYGELTNYNGTYETVGKGAAYIYYSSNPKIGEAGDTTSTNPTEFTEVSIERAIEIANALEAGKKTSENYCIKDVIVDTIFTKAADVTKYGNINLRVKDATGASISCYYTNNLDNQKFTSSTQLPQIGATVTVVGPLKSYVNKTTNETTPEFENGWFTSISAVVGGEEPEPTPEPETPTTAAVTVADGVITLDFTANPLSLTADLTIKASATFNLGETGYKLTLDGSANTSSGTKVLSNQFRMYKNTSFTVAAPEGVNIASITMETAGTVGSSDYSTNNMSVAAGGGTITNNEANGTWNGPANSVTFTNNNQVRINKLIITPAAN